MLRTTLLEIFIFFLPFLFFFLWQVVRGSGLNLQATPVAKLALIGGGLVILLFVLFVLLSPRGSSHIGEIYVPPSLVDGEIVPGHYLPADEGERPVEEEDDGGDGSR
jgi:hypothetical protein